MYVIEKITKKNLFKKHYLKKANAKSYVSRICLDFPENTLHQSIQQKSIQAICIPILVAANPFKRAPLHLRILEIRLFINK